MNQNIHHLQAYVALSRATSKAGLAVRGFTRDCIKVSQAALDFDTHQLVNETWLEVRSSEFERRLLQFPFAITFPRSLLFGAAQRGQAAVGLRS